jgi:hypothetical protein
LIRRRTFVELPSIQRVQWVEILYVVIELLIISFLIMNRVLCHFFFNITVAIRCTMNRLLLLLRSKLLVIVVIYIRLSQAHLGLWLWLGQYAPW